MLLRSTGADLFRLATAGTVRHDMSDMMQHAGLVVGGGRLALDQLMSVARGGALVRMSDDPEVIDRIERARELVVRAVAEGRQLYGVTTRFGGLATGRLGADDAAELQNNVVWIHKTGAGRPIDRSDVRAGMLLRMNALARGASGVRPELIRRFEVLLNAGVTPLVYEFGSIGASGDLVPLSYVAGALTGSDAAFQVEHEGAVIDARVALARVGLAPLRLEAKEGLALINGTSMSTAIAAGCIWDAGRALAVTLGIHGLMLEGLGASVEPFDAFIHAMKAHPGQLWTAARMRALLDGSLMVRASGEQVRGDGTLVQDRYSVRCLAQFVGPIVEGIRQARAQIEEEMNAASDNPLVDVESGTFHQGGNFLAQVPALAMDHLRQYLGLLAKHLDVQVALLMAPEFSNGLPASLVGNADRPANVGLKGLQLTANSMMPLVTFLGNTYVDRFPTHAEQYNQNINSLSYTAALLARESLRVYRSYLAVAALIAVQAVDLRAFRCSASYDPRPLLSPASRRLYEALREIIGRPASETRPYVWNDDEQALDLHVAALAADLAGGDVIATAVGADVEP